MKLGFSRTRRPSSRTGWIAPRAADGRVVYAIGDVHGRADLLEPLLDAVLTDAASASLPMVIGLGDYVDRGPDSRRVIDLLVDLSRQPAVEVRCLRGNHEQALLDFLANAEVGPGWARHGGADTLRSYGVAATEPHADRSAWRDTRDAFDDALPGAHRAFLESTRFCLVSGDYFFSHAGARPDAPLNEQAPQDLMWIRETFLADARPLEKMMVHGHSPAETVHLDHRRIGLDTGAYASGLLCACRFDGPDRRLIQAAATPRGRTEIRQTPL
jgi:serine/threonine protein phosphatase 1